MRALVDLHGKRLGAAIIEAAAEGKMAVVEYKFPRPGTFIPVPKATFVTKIADQICGVGYYK